MNMKPFMDKDFLLSTRTAQQLYHEAAADEPIFDYHCHLPPRDIAEDRRFGNLTEIWLEGDHYKWRVLRANGIDERRVTGDADPYDKFLAWAETVPHLIGNPLYHWTHLELQRYFDISEILNPASAPEIWKAANARLTGEGGLSACGILKKFRVHAVGTTDDPVDTLEWHDLIRTAGKTETRVIPSFRPDPAFNITRKDFTGYINALGKSAGQPISALADLLKVLRGRMDQFAVRGCVSADHGIECLSFRDGGTGGDARWEDAAGEAFAKALAGKAVTGEEAETYAAFLLCFLGAEYCDRGWVMQLHLSALRSPNTRLFRALGPNTGGDAIRDTPVAENLAWFLDALESRGKTPKTILYSLNPNDYYALGSIMGSFQGGGIPGKLQLGSAWWFCDHQDGMEEQMKILGNLGLLSRFIGMLTDSRSFLSYPRHEYFRRILCNILGGWVEEGKIPPDNCLLENMVRDIAFRNAKQYFN
jgi:glucuronate isomerase